MNIWDRFTKPAVSLVTDHPDFALRLMKMSYLVYGLSFALLAVVMAFACYVVGLGGYFAYFFFGGLFSAWLAFNRFKDYWALRGR